MTRDPFDLSAELARIDRHHADTQKILEDAQRRLLVDTPSSSPWLIPVAALAGALFGASATLVVVLLTWSFK